MIESLSNVLQFSRSTCHAELTFHLLWSFQVIRMLRKSLKKRSVKILCTVWDSLNDGILSIASCTICLHIFKTLLLLLGRANYTTLLETRDPVSFDLRILALLPDAYQSLLYHDLYSYLFANFYKFSSQSNKLSLRYIDEPAFPVMCNNLFRWIQLAMLFLWTQCAIFLFLHYQSFLHYHSTLFLHSKIISLDVRQTAFHISLPIFL